MDNIELFKNLLNQLESKENKVKQLNKEIARLTDIQLIRDTNMKKTKKLCKNTIIILLSLLTISIVVNILLLLK
jgi:hypothetical protein